jgi:hypothetical protein
LVVGVGCRLSVVSWWLSSARHYAPLRAGPTYERSLALA